MAIKGKTVLITGGTSGIGLEIVKLLARTNQVVVISRRGTLPPEFSQGHYPVLLHHTDIGNKASLETTVDRIQRTHATIDILINNAAVQYTPELLSDEFNYDSIEKEININFTAVCHLTYLCLPQLLAAKSALILNVNSGLAITPKKQSAVYCATKAALNAFSKSMRYQLAGTSIKIQQVFLPLVDTAMTKDRDSTKLDASRVAEEIVHGISTKKQINDVGKVKLLRLLNYLLPPVAARIMRAG